MSEYHLSVEEIARLKEEHRKCKNKKDVYKINAVILLGKGWSVSAVSEALLMDDGTVRNYFSQYKKGGIKNLLNTNYMGRASFLSKSQERKLQKHLEDHVYYDSQKIIQYVFDKFGVKYSRSGITCLLHRLGFTYKKTKLVPGKEDIEAQINFIEKYDEIMANKGENDPFYFTDGTHPHNNVQPGYGWIKKGTDKEVKTNTGRERLNINGAIDPKIQSMVFRFDNTINSQSTIKLLKSIERKHKNANVIYVVCDNAKYYKCHLVNEFLEHSKIEVLFLPAYAPNLNLIERLWKLFHEKVLFEYYEKFDTFKSACYSFFKNIRKYKNEIKSRLTDNFELIIG